MNKSAAGGAFLAAIAAAVVAMVLPDIKRYMHIRRI
ncbi:DUF6893 family small protein [Streptomyces sp. NPDC048603]